MSLRPRSSQKNCVPAVAIVPPLSPGRNLTLAQEALTASASRIKTDRPARMPIEATPLAFLTDDAVIGRHPHVLRQHLQQLGLTISSLAQSAADHSFCLRSSLVRCGDLTLLAVAHTPLSIRALNDDDGIVVILPYGGQADVISQSRPFMLDSTAELAYLPGQYLDINSSDFNSVIVRIDRLRLQATAESLVGAHACIPQLREDLATARMFGADHPLSAALVLQLRRTVQMFDTACLQDSGLLDPLQLDELIYRILAELVGRNSQREPALAVQDPSLQAAVLRDQILEDLVAWIQANLHRPIALGELEQRSAYSRRSLQYTFKRRFGCSPMHWIRHQRLQRALSQLQHPEADTSVRKVAFACGYTHLSAFGRDFRNQFHLRASDVLRQARQQREPAS